MNEKDIIDDIKKFITVPKDFKLVSKENEIRNNKPINIYRFQSNGEFKFNDSRIIVITDAYGNIESLKNLSSMNYKNMLNKNDAKKLAIDIFNNLDKSYAKGLSFIRVEDQNRSFIKDGETIDFPVQWIKFAHENGSYSWVTFAANGEVIEIERNSVWDYLRGRRKTEMWDNDDWILARLGKGPQLPSPNALA